MKSDTKKLILTEKDILGRGTNKIVYYHPEDKNKCIKFSLDADDKSDLRYELIYRKACRDKVEKSTLLTKYFGTLETNLGTGHVFELVRDFDGKLSETFESLIIREKNSAKVREVLTLFKEKLFEEMIITYKIFPDNFMIQRLSEQEYRIRLIDGIGMHVLVPVPYFSGYVAMRRQKRVWEEFLKQLQDKFGFQDIVG